MYIRGLDSTEFAEWAEAVQIGGRDVPFGVGCQKLSHLSSVGFASTEFYQGCNFISVTKFSCFFTVFQTLFEGQ